MKSLDYDNKEIDRNEYDSIPWLRDLPDSYTETETDMFQGEENEAEETTNYKRHDVTMQCKVLAPAEVESKRKTSRDRPSVTAIESHALLAEGCVRETDKGWNATSKDLDASINMDEECWNSAVIILSRSYIKNAVVLGVGLMLCLSPVYAQRCFLSSTGRQKETGRQTLAIFYLAVCFGFIISSDSGACLTFGWRPKRTITMAVIGTLPMSVACAAGTPPLITFLAAIITGLSVSCISVVQGTYLSSISVTFAALNGCHYDSVFLALASFMAVMHQLSQLLGNLMTSAVYLMSDLTNLTTSDYRWNVLAVDIYSGQGACNIHRWSFSVQLKHI
jgi:hypothetical protein